MLLSTDGITSYPTQECRIVHPHEQKTSGNLNVWKVLGGIVLAALATTGAVLAGRSLMADRVHLHLNNELVLSKVSSALSQTEPFSESFIQLAQCQRPCNPYMEADSAVGSFYQALSEGIQAQLTITRENVSYIREAVVMYEKSGAWDEMKSSLGLLNPLFSPRILLSQCDMITKLGYDKATVHFDV